MGGGCTYLVHSVSSSVIGDRVVVHSGVRRYGVLGLINMCFLYKEINI
jgi:hypothetical protein